MGVRLAAASGWVLAALMVAPAARAQGFFEYYEMSPRQIAGILAEDGYELRGPLQRRGDVYVCDAVSISGRPMRLIVDAHHGRVLEHFATGERRRYAGEHFESRAPRDDAERWSDEARPSSRRDQFALGDPLNPNSSRGHGDDGLFSSKPTPPAAVPEPTPKPKHHAVKKHHEPAVAAAPATSSSPEPTTVAEPPKPSPSVAAVAPSGPTPAKPAIEVAKPTPPPEIVKPEVEAIKPAPTPTPEPSKAAEAHATVEAEKAPAVDMPKPQAPHKKINDLPIGTLD